MPDMAWDDDTQDDDAQRDQDRIYGLELIPENGDEAASPATRDAKAEQRETIGTDTAHRLPRTLRLAGLLAIAVAFTIALWPTTKSKPSPSPTRIRVAAAVLAPSGRITTLTLVLANDAPSPASIGEAEIEDADGRLIASDRQWPAGDIPPGSTLAVDIPVPYACDTHIPQHLPIALHVSVSSPQQPNPPQNLSYPLDTPTWQEFEHYQSGICNSAANAAVSVGPVSVSGIDPATHSVKILTRISVNEPLMIDRISTINQAFRITTDPAAPLTLPATGWQSITTTWQVTDCKSMADQWDTTQALILAYEGPTGGSFLSIPLPEDVVTQLSATACPR
jgi:hypothetical protein